MSASGGEAHEQDTTLTDIRPCWFVGAAWSGTGDQAPRFAAEGTWKNGFKNRDIDFVRSMRPGDRIARAKRDAGHNATRFLQMLDDHGGIAGRSQVQIGLLAVDVRPVLIFAGLVESSSRQVGS